MISILNMLLVFPIYLSILKSRDVLTFSLWVKPGKLPIVQPLVFFLSYFPFGVWSEFSVVGTEESAGTYTRSS